MNQQPKVSIITITYNHEKYIREALDSFVSQKTKFKFEIIIADDCSKDKTPEIIMEYSKKYPDIFKPILRKKNLGAAKNFIEAISKTSGEYIALCEGDDYWINPNKLQKQVDFLDNNPTYALCFHPVRVFYEDGSESEFIFPPPEHAEFTLLELIKNNYIQTNSVMYRRIVGIEIPGNIMPLDWYLHLYHAQFGKIGFINKTMSVYRRHSGGIWWQTTRGGDIDEIWKKNGAGHIALYIELLKIYGDTPEFRQIIDKHIWGTVSAINRIDGTQKTHILQTYKDGFSEQINALLLSLCRTIEESHNLLESTSSKSLEELKATVEKLRLTLERIEELEREKSEILNSKSYRIGHRLYNFAHLMRITNEK